MSGRDRNVVLTAVGLQALVRTPLSKVDGIVVWHLVATLPVSGEIVSQTQLSSDLAISSVYISGAMKRLCSYGFLLRGAKVGRFYHYKINPAFFRILS